jgi:O-antigen/teichoic acid export membrane protein
VLSTVINFLTPILVLPILTKVLDPDELGVVLYHETIARYISLFFLLGIPIYGVRELAQNKNKFEHTSNFIYSMVIFQLVLVLIFLVIAFIFWEMTLLNLLTALLALFYGFSMEWVLHGLEKFKSFIVRNLVIKIIFVFNVYFFVRSANDSIIFLSILVISQMSLMVLNLLALKKEFGVFKLSRIKILEYLKPISIFFTSIIVISIYTVFDVILLGELSTKSEVAIYNIGQRIPKALSTIVLALFVVFIPRLNSYYSKRDINFSKTLRLSLNSVFYIALPLSVLLIINSEIIINSVISNHAYGQSIFVLKLLSGLPFLISLSNFLGVQILTTINQDSKLLLAALVGAVVSLFLNLVLTPNLGAIGASVASLSAEFSVTLSLLLFVGKLGFRKFICLEDFGIKELSVLFTFFLVYFINFFISYSLSSVICMNLLVIFCFFVISEKYRFMIRGFKAY